MAIGYDFFKVDEIQGKKGQFRARSDYARLANLGCDTAINDLNAFITEGWLKKYGLGRTVVYLLNHQP